MLAHEVLEHAKVERPAVRRAQLLVQPLQLGPRLQQLHEPLEIRKVQEPAVLHVRLLHVVVVPVNTLFHTE